MGLSHEKANSVTVKGAGNFWKLLVIKQKQKKDSSILLGILGLMRAYLLSLTLITNDLTGGL